ncbi:hypothetical protein ACIQFP_10585 [Nocardiopsis alba]|uniref:hypothetical protein n=1 Tax=Nocardiopsis alba TaxID=53437 RepID=UPI0038294B90
MPDLSFEALSARYPGGIPEADKARAEAALEDAESAVRVVAGFGEGEAFPEALASFTLRVARREFSNPLNLHNETLADYTRGMATNRDILTEEDRAQIGRILGRSPIVAVRVNARWPAEDVRRITPVESWRWLW